jgi:iron(III) transport system substrate-binding protein
MQRTGFFVAAVLVVGGLVASAVFWPKQEGVTLYCSTDDVIAAPILADFERETGVHVKPVFDTEASKTVGRANALKLERDDPRCDVFWNNEILQTVRLANDGIFAAYVSPSAADIPAEYKDPGGLWTGFAARPRILIVSTDAKMWEGADRPKSMNDFVDPKWKGRCVIAQPLSGTTLTHFIVLMSVLGKRDALKWFDGLRANQCGFPVGNGPAASAVGARQSAFGFSDIDDFHEIEHKGQPVAVVYPDQGPGQVGTLLLPNTVALVKGGPKPELGKKLIDYLLSKKVEQSLAESTASQVPLRPDVPRPPHVKVPPTDFHAMKVDWQDAAKDYDARLDQLQALWGR